MLEQELEGQRQAVAVTVDEGGLERVIREYLSPAHRDRPDQGCVNAALLEDIARRPRATRDAYTRHLLDLVDVTAAHLDRRTPDQARLDALVVLGSMTGTLQLSRAVTDLALADAILERGVEAALRLAVSP